MTTPSRAPIHFPHIDSTTHYNVPKCSCSWMGFAYPQGPVGEQLALEAAIAHARRSDYVKISNLVADPQYAFEVNG